MRFLCLWLAYNSLATLFCLWLKFLGHNVVHSLKGFYQQLNFLWYCSHMHCCLHNRLHINLHILFIIQVKKY